MPLPRILDKWKHRRRQSYPSGTSEATSRTFPFRRVGDVVDSIGGFASFVPLVQPISYIATSFLYRGQVSFLWQTRARRAKHLS